MSSLPQCGDPANIPSQGAVVWASLKDKSLKLLMICVLTRRKNHIWPSQEFRAPLKDPTKEPI